MKRGRGHAQNRNLRELFGCEEGAPPAVDLAAERRNGDFVRGLIRSGQITVCHDLSDGGLACAAAEMALASGVGIELSVTPGPEAHGLMFGEDQGRYLLGAADAASVLEAAKAAGVHASLAGTAGGDSFSSPGLFVIPLAELKAANEGWLPAYMGGASAAVAAG